MLYDTHRTICIDEENRLAENRYARRGDLSLGEKTLMHGLPAMHQDIADSISTRPSDIGRHTLPSGFQLGSPVKVG